MFATSKNEDYYCVCMGAGMGLAFAGDLADICFLDLVERQLLLTQSVRAQCNLVCYYRFMDDGFFTTDCSRDKLLEFSGVLKRKAGCLKINFEAISSVEMPVLDVERWDCTGILDHRLFSKTTSQWTPLLPSSFHNPSIHRSWPLPQIERIRKKHSGRTMADIEIDAFKDKCQHATGIVFPTATGPKPVKKVGGLPRLALPFRAEWFEARLSSMAATAWHESGLKDFGETEEFLGLQISWMLPNKHLTDRIWTTHGGVRGR